MPHYVCTTLCFTHVSLGVCYITYTLRYVSLCLARCMLQYICTALMSALSYYICYLMFALRTVAIFLLRVCYITFQQHFVLFGFYTRKLDTLCPTLFSAMFCQVYNATFPLGCIMLSYVIHMLRFAHFFKAPVQVATGIYNLCPNLFNSFQRNSMA